MQKMQKGVDGGENTAKGKSGVSAGLGNKSGSGVTWMPPKSGGKKVGGGKGGSKLR